MSSKKNKWSEHPKIYEINTWPWLNGLSEKFNHQITLQNIPDEVLENVISKFDAIWLMGVWERSPLGREIALTHPDLQNEYLRALSDFKPEDVVGSPYAVHNYRVDPHLGGQDGLSAFRTQLTNRNQLLLLDFVPNHVAIDHPWTLENPSMFVQGSPKDLESHSNEFFSVGSKIYGNGKDPYFPAWTDTVQINAFSSAARQEAISTLKNIGKQCDGVRCDMAMLMTNGIFSRTWGERAGPIPEKEYWRVVTRAIREEYPEFLFIAEVYWDMEWELQQQGFDFCYDKRLYERMSHENALAIRDHLIAEWNYQRKLVRFIENHDELRAKTQFGEEKSQMAAILALTLPGASLIHEGQVEGLGIKLPVQLGRRAPEKKNEDLKKFYLKLLNIISNKKLGESQWNTCKIEHISVDNFSSNNIISYIWWIESNYLLIVVNYSPFPSQAHVKNSAINYDNNDWTFTDLLSQEEFTYKGKDLNEHGLYIDLPPWRAQLFDVKKVM